MFFILGSCFLAVCRYYFVGFLPQLINGFVGIRVFHVSSWPWVVMVWWLLNNIVVVQSPKRWLHLCVVWPGAVLDVGFSSWKWPLGCFGICLSSKTFLPISLVAAMLGITSTSRKL